MSDQVAAPDPTDVDELPEQLRVRREKLEKLRASGVEAYPVAVDRTHTLAAVRAQFPELPPDTATGTRVGVAGRVIFLRNTGKLCFATLREGGPDGGTELQAMLSADRIGAEALAGWKSAVDLGDHVFVSGEVITSRRGELSVLADQWQLASKALRPLPVAHKPMSEETRVRQRYVDLIVRPEARRMVQVRYEVQRSLRDSLDRRGFVEIDTPVLQAVYGGAAARPFRTHMNAFDVELYLRIALELYLKRAVVGGIDRVFELSRVFRNEGVDSTHNPEFTMLELYQAYADYDTMATLTRELIQQCAIDVFGSTTVTHVDGTEFDLSGEWGRISLYEAVSAAVGESITPDTSPARLVALAEALDLQVNPAWPAGKLVEELFEFHVMDSLVAPTFVVDYPADNAPLTRQHRSLPGRAEKWDLYILGVERATAYSELVDPVRQRELLVAQSLAAANGDPEAMQLDEDFLRALEYGMPPTGGMGLGIDRLLQVLTGARGIRETVLFPLTRPE